MFTLFRPDLDHFARQVIEEQQRFREGNWPQDELRALQLERFTETVRYVSERSPFYRRHLASWDGGAAGSPLTAAQIERLPFTTKNDLRQQLFDVPALPLHKAWVFYETTGTTGRATPCPRDEHDSIVNNTALTLAYRDIFDAHGSDHVVAVMGPTELHSTGDTFGDVFRNLGHTVVKMWPHSPAVGFPRALKLLGELPITAVVCTPGMALSLFRAAQRQQIDPRSFGIRFMFALGELASPAMLRNISQLWGAAVYNCMYASQEASILATCGVDGLLHTEPLNNYYEIVDASGAPIQLTGDSGQGELVVTSLYQGAKPLVRYRTGDMVRLHAKDARPVAGEAIQPIGRAADVLHLAGRPCYALDLEETVLSHGRGAIDYRLLIENEGSGDKVTVYLEPGERSDDPGDDIPAVIGAMREKFGVNCEVVLGPMDAITSTGAMVSWKAARIHDRRTGPEPERAAALSIAAARSGT